MKNEKEYVVVFAKNEKESSVSILGALNENDVDIVEFVFKTLNIPYAVSVIEKNTLY